MNKNRLYLKEFVDTLTKLRKLSSDDLVNRVGLSSYGELNQYLLEKSKAKLAILYPSLSSILKVSQDDFDKIMKQNDYAPLVRAKDKLNQQEHSNNHINKVKNNRVEPFIERVREEQGFTRQRLASRLHTSVQGIKRIENSNHPNVRTLIRVALSLQIPIAKLTHYYHYSDNSVKQIMQNAQNAARKHMAYLRSHTKLSSLSDYLLSCRHNLHLSQVKVAKKCNIGTATISRLETGKAKRIDIKVMARLAKAYHIPLMNILVRSKEYKSLEVGSPAYKIIGLCQHYDLSIPDLARKANISSIKIETIMKNLQKYNSHMSTDSSKSIIEAFHLPNDFFENKSIPNNKENKSNKSAKISNNKSKSFASKYVRKPKHYRYNDNHKKTYRNKTVCRVPNKFRKYHHNYKNNTHDNNQVQNSNNQNEKDQSKRIAKIFKNELNKLLNSKKSQNSIKNKLNTATEQVNSFSKLVNSNHKSVPHSDLEYHAKINSLTDHVTHLEARVVALEKITQVDTNLLTKIAAGLGRLYHK